MNFDERQKVKEHALQYAIQNAEKWNKIREVVKEGSDLYFEAQVAYNAYKAAVEHFEKEKG